MERLSAWLLTESGKKAVYYAASAISMGVVSLKFVPNTFLLDEYKKLFHYYRFGSPAPLPKELTTRFEKAVELAQVDEVDKELLHPFQVIGFDMFHAGTTYSKYGAIIGIPINFTYKSAETVDKSEILVDGEAVAWGTPEADRFLNSLILSENAQLYAMAREIKMAESPKFLLDTFYVLSPVPLYYGFTHQINKQFQLFSRARGIRIIVYTLSAVFMTGYYYFFKDFTQVYFEHSVDKQLKELNPIFAEGGKEFYTKLMSRNVALRSLLGRRGEKYFTTLGNENYLIRQKHMPLSDRKLFFEQSVLNS